MQRKLAARSLLYLFLWIAAAFVEADPAHALPAPPRVNEAQPALFPEREPISRIFARSRQTFKGYRGRGSLLIENFGAGNAEIYINGSRLQPARQPRGN